MSLGTDCSQSHRVSSNVGLGATQASRVSDNQTIYQVKHSLFSEYLRSPAIQMKP